MFVDRSSKTRQYDGLPSPSRFHGCAGSTALEGHRTKRAPSRRRGTMFVETAIGVALLVVVMIAVAQLVAVVAKQRRAVAQTRQATEEAANLMERAIALPWDGLTAEAAARFEVSPESAAALDDPQLSITVADEEGAPAAKQVAIELSWRDHAGRRVEPVRIVAWKHQPVAAE